MNKPETPKKVAHIGIAVASIDEALPYYEQLLGLELQKIEEVESEQVRVAFLKIGDTKIELLESLSPEGPIAKHIEKRGAGLHHIAFEVDDLEARVAGIKAAGVKVIPDQPKRGAEEALITFLHPKAMGGALIELCQYPKK